MLKKNQLLTVTVTDINNLGYGVCRVDGGVVFVAGAVAGDEAEIKIIKVAADYAVARTEKLLTPSPYRVEDDCQCANACGGCAYRAVSYDFELTLKQKYVENAFRKAGLGNAVIRSVLHTGQTEGYRNKVQYPVGEAMQIGYYARHSHRIVSGYDCPLQDRAFTPVLAALDSFLQTHPSKAVKHLYLRRAKGTGQMLVCPVVSEKNYPYARELTDMLTAKFPEIACIQLNINPDEGNVILGKKCVPLYGEGAIEDILCGLRFRISPLSFYQVNHDAAEILYGEALKRAAECEPQAVCDLYCGTGTIGLYFASQLPQIHLTGLEIVPDAVENAKYNAKRNGITNAAFLCADAADADLSGFDCVTVDPPRKGCDPTLLAKIAAQKIKRLVYVSCNPDTLARDAAILLKSGYEMGQVTPVDLFPRTGSVECVTHFEMKTEEM